MSARIIDGKAVAAALRDTLARRVSALGFTPGLRVVRVGEDPASGVYVRNKDRAAQQAGFNSATIPPRNRSRISSFTEARRGRMSAKPSSIGR